MKKLGKIKNLLSREEMKQIQGGSGSASGNCWVTCKSGSTYNIRNCNRAPDGACHSTGWTWCSCWAW